MTRTESTDEAKTGESVDQRPRLFSFDFFTSYWISGWPLLAWVWIATTQSPLRNAITLGLNLVWVFGDVVIYRIRNHHLPPAPPRWPSSWGRHNRWTVPLLFIVLIVGAIQNL